MELFKNGVVSLVLVLLLVNKTKVLYGVRRDPELLVAAAADQEEEEIGEDGKPKAGALLVWKILGMNCWCLEEETKEGYSREGYGSLLCWRVSWRVGSVWCREERKTSS